MRKEARQQAGMVTEMLEMRRSHTIAPEPFPCAIGSTRIRLPPVPAPGHFLSSRRSLGLCVAHCAHANACRIMGNWLDCGSVNQMAQSNGLPVV